MKSQSIDFLTSSQTRFQIKSKISVLSVKTLKISSHFFNKASLSSIILAIQSKNTNTKLSKLLILYVYIYGKLANILF